MCRGNAAGKNMKNGSEKRDLLGYCTEVKYKWCLDYK